MPSLALFLVVPVEKQAGLIYEFFKEHWISEIARPAVLYAAWLHDPL
jgi:hypothetical protein